MPIHDWTRVSAGTWHAFHTSWISEIQLALNGGLLPPDYYAQAEQIVGPYGPDVLALQSDGTPGANGTPGAAHGDTGGVAVLTAPPRTRLTAESDEVGYVARRRKLVIRHVSGDRIIALLEIVSPGNKASQHAMDSFVGKAAGAITEGFHLLVIDLFPPTPRDPNGMHAAIWGEFSTTPFVPPPGEPLTLAAYSAGAVRRAYIEPTAVGRELLEMPLFLDPDGYVNVPLEATYAAAYRGVPRKWRAVLD